MDSHFGDSRFCIKIDHNRGTATALNFQRHTIGSQRHRPSAQQFLSQLPHIVWLVVSAPRLGAVEIETATKRPHRLDPRCQKGVGTDNPDGGMWVFADGGSQVAEADGAALELEGDGLQDLPVHVVHAVHAILLLLDLSPCRAILS